MLVSCDLFGPNTGSENNNIPAEPTVIHVCDIVVTPTNLSMALGETQKLTCTITPEDATDKSVTWSSNASSTVSVDQDGTVHALGYGGAIITATTTNGNKTAACMVIIPDK